MEGAVDGRRGHAPDKPSGERGCPGDLTRRQDRGVHRGLRGPHGDLHDAAGRRPAHAPHVRHGTRQHRRLDPRRPAALLHRGVLDVAQRAADGPGSAGRGPRRTAPPGPGRGRLVRRRRQDALLHAFPLPGQPHQALQRRHGPEHLEILAGQRGRPLDRRLQRNQQAAHVVGGAGLFCLGPRRHHEPLVHGPGRQEPAAVDRPRGLGDPVTGPARRPRRLSTRCRSAVLRHRLGQGRSAVHRAELRPGPDAGTLDPRPLELPHLGPRLPGRRPSGAHRPWSGLRGAAQAGPLRGGDAQGRRTLPRGPLPARRRVAGGPLRRIGRGRTVETARRRRR